LLKWLDEEEDRVKRNLEEGAGILQLDEDALSGKVAKTVDLMAGYVLSYEDYYELDDFVGVAKKPRQGEGKMPFEEFAKKMASANIFDNDLLEQQYKFWESAEDREARLKLLWIDLKRKNALGGIDAVSREEQTELNTQIVELLRRVRWRTDQELTRRNIEPIFKDFYTDKYDKEEFLIDAGFEFMKLKNLLSKNPKVLKDDPVLSLEYYKIIQLLK